MELETSSKNENMLESISDFFPWRRYFARTLDLIIYNFAFRSFCMLVLRYQNENYGMAELINIIASMVLMVLIEPLLISKFGTTLGKYVMGIYVRGKDGKLLTNKEAFNRTYSVLIFGVGLQIPFFSIYTNVKSYSVYKNKKSLPWEYDNSSYLKDKKFLRIIAYMVVVIVASFIVAICDFTARAPKNKGDITVAEFASDYNRLLDYEDLRVKADNGSTKRLSESGQFVTESDNLLDTYSQLDDITLTYIEEDGIMKGFELTMSGSTQGAIYDSGIYEAIALIDIFVKSQESYSIFSEELVDSLNYILKNYCDGFDLTVEGVRITQVVENQGYDDYNNILLFPAPGTDKPYYKSTLRVVIEE